MLDALAGLAAATGGRLMYLGGNGFYWVTSLTPRSPHVARGAPRARRHPALGLRAGRGAPRLDRRARRPVAAPRPPAAGALRRRLQRPGLRRLAALPRAPGSPRPARGVRLRGRARGRDVRRLRLGARRRRRASSSTAPTPRSGTPPHALVLATATGFSDVYQGTVEDLLDRRLAAGRHRLAAGALRHRVLRDAGGRRGVLGGVDRLVRRARPRRRRQRRVAPHRRTCCAASPSPAPFAPPEGA